MENGKKRSLYLVSADEQPTGNKHFTSRWHCINMQKRARFPVSLNAMPCASSGGKTGRCAMIFRCGNMLENRFFDNKKMPLQRLLDAIMTLTFFDAVAIVIATCSHRDSNMMLST